MDIGLPVLDGLQELVDQSLLRQVPRPGAAALRDAGDDPRVRGRAAGRRCRRRTGSAAPTPRRSWPWSRPDGRPHAGLARKEWLERVDAEHNNIRAALGWYREHDPPAALRLAAAMAAFWSLRGHHTEGRQRLGELLGLVPDPSVARVSALNGAAWLAIDQGDYAHAADLLGESIGLSQALGDTVGEGIATVYLGRCKMSSRRISAAGHRTWSAPSRWLTEAGDRPAIAFAMFYSGLVALLTGRWKPPATCSPAAPRWPPSSAWRR